MDERALSRRPRLPLLLAIVLLYSCPSAGASSVGEIAAEIVWNLIGAISRIRHGPDTDWADQGRQSGSLLTDPDFLYATFYREDEDVGVSDSRSSDGGERSTASPTMAASFHSNLLRVLDILEIEHRLRRLRQADQRAIIDETIDESATPSVVEGEERGGAVGSCNMADIGEEDTSRTAEAGSSSNSAETAACSIKRSKRQAEELEPYVPYLGFIFYSFPIFSFTLPFGGQLKLFGYDFI